MKKPYLHAHWQPFSPTQWQTFSILSPKASTKSLPERHYWRFEKKQRKPVIGFRADIPFDERHSMRFEATHNKNKIDIYNKEGKKLNGIISKTATVYAGYTHTQSVSESTRFRSGIGLGYSTSKRNVLWEKGATATPVSPQSELLTLQVDGEIRQNLDEGCSLTP